jgi:predicted HTH domain antitoxin
MSSFNLEIPDDILDEARIPPSERASVLKRELAVQLYAREILPKAAARRLSGMDRVTFDDLLGQRGIASRLTPDDLDADLADLAGYRQTARAGERRRMSLEEWASLPEDEPGELVDARRRSTPPSARFYWLIDPDDRTLEIFELQADAHYLRVRAASEGTIDVPACEGLRLDLDALWAHVDHRAS